VANKGCFLSTDHFLNTSDYLTSTNGLFFASMQSDGNFCVYRGSGPADNRGYLWGTQKLGDGGQFFAIMQSDGNFCVYRGSGPGDNRGYLWGTQKLGDGGQFFAVMQNDGNFCVYKGTGPADNCGFVWGTMKTDPVEDVEIASIEYDVAAAKTLQSGPAELYRQIVRNDTTQAQSSTISGSATVSETSGWSDSLAVKVGVKTSFKTGIPCIAEGKVEVSVEVTNTYTWNGSTTNTKTWGFNTPVTVPPHAVIVGMVSATISTIAVPYKLRGTFLLKSGARIPGSVTGIYTGTNSHDLTVTFIQRDPVTAEIHSTREPLRATST
jgi:Clostridium epsilon toxin ETX/Bacillus mosquitocidal toxin MTX2